MWPCAFFPSLPLPSPALTSPIGNVVVWPEKCLQKDVAQQHRRTVSVSSHDRRCSRRISTEGLWVLKASQEEPGGGEPVGDDHQELRSALPRMDVPNRVDIESRDLSSMWGETTTSLLDRLDVMSNQDQRRLAASRYWQRRLEAKASTLTASKSESNEPKPPSSWEEATARFEEKGSFLRREKAKMMEEAAAFLPELFVDEDLAKAWVASYRLSNFETRRQAQRVFSWAIPDESALDYILSCGKPILEVGSGMGYWASLLKARSGDENRVRCLDPFAPRIKPPDSSHAGLTESETASVEMISTSSETYVYLQNSSLDNSRDDVDDDTWFADDRPPFTLAERGSFEIIAKDPKGFESWALFICWPSNSQWPTGCLNNFKGDNFFYVGEGEGGATRMPWALLRDHWRLEQRVDIPQWPGFKDALWWYRRRSSATVETPAPEM